MIGLQYSQFPTGKVKMKYRNACAFVGVVIAAVASSAVGAEMPTLRAMVEVTVSAPSPDHRAKEGFFARKAYRW